MDAYLKDLLNLSEQNLKQMNLSVKIFERTFDTVLKNAPEQDKGVIEKMQILTKKALTLAKEGKQTEANEILNQIRNECKSNK